MNTPRSEAQITASRANGALSHGPVTEEGQRIAQSNNLKHGLLSNTILIENESAEIFENLLLSHIRELDPQGAPEMFSVEATVACAWRQIRMWGMTTGGHNLEIVRQPETSPEIARHPMPARAYIAVSDMNRRDNGMSTLVSPNHEPTKEPKPPPIDTAGDPERGPDGVRRGRCIMPSIMRTAAILLSAAFLLPVLAPAQLVEDINSGRGNCCLAGTAQTLANQLLDWNQFGRYHADNERLKAQPADPGRVVFLGDSITDGWRLDQYFPGKSWVNRGISGQTTPQMLDRMFEDVINLKPAAVIIFAGTNDIARNTGPETIAMVEENFEAMTELAQLHGIKVILCSLTPVSDYGPTKMTLGRPPADILKLNAWLKEYAAKSRSVYADYYSATVDDKGLLKEGYSRDGLHPNDKGYELMVPVAAAAIQQALGK